MFTNILAVGQKGTNERSISEQTGTNSSVLVAMKATKPVKCLESDNYGIYDFSFENLYRVLMKRKLGMCSGKSIANI